jgi:tetratricopeptide (TPR) repeat protein
MNVPFHIKNNIISIEELKKVKGYLLALLKTSIKRGSREGLFISLQEIDKWINLDPVIIFRYYATADSFDHYYMNYSHENNNFEEIPDQELRNSKPWRDKGWNLYRSGQSEKAQKYFDKAIQLDSNDVDAWKGRSLNGLAIGQTNSRYHDVTNEYLNSLYYIEEAIKLDANNAELLSIKALVLRNLNKDDEAVKYINKAIQLDSNNISYLIDKAYALLKLGKYDESLNHFNDIINLGHNSYDIWNGKASCLFYLGRYNDALIALNEAIKLDANNAELLSMKALVLRNLNKDDEASELLDNTLKMDPHCANAWYNRACLNVKKGNIKQGLSDLDHSIYEGRENYRNLAKEDKDFDSLRNDERFRLIVRQ